MRTIIRGIIFGVAMLGLFVLNMYTPASIAHAADSPDAPHTVTAWIQVLDSCQQALGGERMTLTGNGTHVVKDIPRSGLKTVGRVGGQCPLQWGDCPRVGNGGCTTFDLPVPDSGDVEYTITETKGAPQYAYCLRATCHGPEQASVTVTSDGKISATVTDSTVHKKFPENGDTYDGTPHNPILFHSWDNR